ncbi:MAG: hypothetical protein JXB49_24855 [Bacteroidales bacterium]|nr:hypothetical protein [Bacteroidales bacterium]
MKNRKKLHLVIFTFCFPLLFIACKSGNPVSGEWTGNGISFTVADNRKSINVLTVMIPLGNERYYAQEFYELEIKESKFIYSFDGNAYLGIPQIELEGEFVSNNLAKGVFNDYDWTATPK